MTEDGGLRGLDVVIRFTDLGHLPRLEQCVFALFGQVMGDGAGRSALVPMQIHVILPRFSFAEVQAVRSALQPLRGLSDAVSLALHNWDYPEPHDLRVPMLNLGLERATGRYVACLEVGDLLHPDAYLHLLTRLQDSNAALALGGLAEQRVAWWGDVILPLPVADRWQQGDGHAAPAFLLDRTRIALPDLVFQAARPEAAIDVFLERMRERYSVDGEYPPARLGFRQILRDR
jgi:hypothetical protein